RSCRYDNGDRGRRHFEGGAGGGGRRRLPVAIVDQLGGFGADRRRPRDKCRRQQHRALWQCPRPRARPRSRTAGWAGVERAATPAEHYALIELATPREGAGLRASLEEVLAAAMEMGIVLDAVIAESGMQRAALWKLREEHSEAQKLAGASVKNDVSVPVSKVPELIRRATDICERLVPGIRCVPFGHLGDGNIHLNLVQPEDADPVAFLARDHELMDAVNE